jgi:hypothetical protein
MTTTAKRELWSYLPRRSIFVIADNAAFVRRSISNGSSVSPSDSTRSAASRKSACIRCSPAVMVNLDSFKSDDSVRARQEQAAPTLQCGLRYTTGSPAQSNNHLHGKHGKTYDRLHDAPAGFRQRHRRLYHVPRKPADNRQCMAIPRASIPPEGSRLHPQSSPLLPVWIYE